MAKENMFAKASSKRVQEQTKIKDNLQNANGADDVNAASTEPRTTMTLSMSVDDKMALKMIAMKRKKTVSKMLHEWIIELQEEENGE